MTGDPFKTVSWPHSEEQSLCFVSYSMFNDTCMYIIIIMFCSPVVEL